MKHQLYLNYLQIQWFGRFKFELKPSKAENYELGWKGNWSRFTLEANLFYILSSNEILPYELEAFPGRAFYENTGETKRFGFEFFGSYKINSWEFIASLTEASYQFSGEK